MKWLRHALGTVAMAGFVLSLIAHVAALDGMDVASAVPAVWSLHLGVFVVFLPFVLISRKDMAGNKSLIAMAKGLPPWLGVLGGALFAYALLNFLLFLLHTEGGSASAEGGKYFLKDHGRLIRQISATEFAAFQANMVRGFSGHWLVFYFFPAAYFLFWKPPAERAASQATGIAS